MHVVYAVAMGLIVAASLGTPYMVAYCLIVGPLVGWIVGKGG